MDAIKSILDVFLHVDDHLHALLEAWGPWTYVLLFAIILCETGLVVTPFLPGDSLLFAAGAMAAIQPDEMESAEVYNTVVERRRPAAAVGAPGPP